ncbi:hypothetical protein KCP78_16715 [Salmonella enterica subsp. enterica]|nr:hypothetical protein KCP78_16715 [Salmonella enterica subsp. enterica]
MVLCSIAGKRCIRAFNPRVTSWLLKIDGQPVKSGRRPSLRTPRKVAAGNHSAATKQGIQAATGSDIKFVSLQPAGKSDERPDLVKFTPEWFIPR